MSAIESSLRLEIAQYQQSLAKAKGDALKFKNSIRRVGGGLDRDMFGGIGRFVAGGALIMAGRQAMDTVVSMDRLTRGMTTLEGSAEAATARMQSLRDAARLPGLNFEQAVKGDIRLRSVGISAELSREALIQMGNALSLAGGTASDLDGVVLALTQIVSKGKVSAEEINQIAERVPQVRAVMKDMFGTADTEVLQKMNLDAETFVSTLVEGFGRLDRAQAGLDEKMNNFTASIKAATNAFAEGFVRGGVEGADAFGAALDRNIDSIGELGAAASSALGTAVDFIVDAGKGLGQLAWEAKNAAEAMLEGKTQEEYAAEYQDMLALNQALADRAEIERQIAAIAAQPPPPSPFETAASTAASPAAAPTGTKDTDARKRATETESLRTAQQRLNDAQKTADREKMTNAQKIAALQADLAAEEAAAAAFGTLEGAAAQTAQIDHQIKKIELQREINGLMAEEQDIQANQQAGKKALAEEIQMAQAKMAGNTTLLAQMERELAIREKAKQIEDQTGVTPALARASAAMLVDAAAPTPADGGSKSTMRRRYMGSGLDEHARNQLRDGTAATALGANSISNRSRSKLASRYMGGASGSLAERAAVAAGRQDAREKKDTTGLDLGGKILNVLTTGLS
jgi:tape measure domain-containing protein